MTSKCISFVLFALSRWKMARMESGDSSHSLSSYRLLPFRYFEQRLRVAEETYREEIALLQLRLVESALEESVLKTTESR